MGESIALIQSLERPVTVLFSRWTDEELALRRAPPDDAPPLPEGWYVQETESGERYYWNEVTGDTTWDPPGVETAQEQAGTRFARHFEAGPLGLGFAHHLSGGTTPALMCCT